MPVVLAQALRQHVDGVGRAALAAAHGQDLVADHEGVAPLQALGHADLPLEERRDLVEEPVGLLQVAQAFDVGLDVRFLPFSKLLDDVTTLRPESFSVASFDEEIKAGSFWTTRRGRKIQTRNRKSQHRKQNKPYHRGDYQKVISIESYGQRSLLSASAGAI